MCSREEQGGSWAAREVQAEVEAEAETVGAARARGKVGSRREGWRAEAGAAAGAVGSVVGLLEVRVAEELLVAS